MGHDIFFLSEAGQRLWAGDYSTMGLEGWDDDTNDTTDGPQQKSHQRAT